MKPRVMLLAVFTALVGLMIAPGHLDPLLGFIAIFGIAAGAGAAGVLNYLETSPEKPSASYEQVRKHLVSKGLRIVEKPDLEYLARQSVREDLRIMLRTVPVVVFRRGAW